MAVKKTRDEESKSIEGSEVQDVDKENKQGNKKSHLSGTNYIQ